jgi:SSS family solute:Na+ symporter
MSPDLWIIAVFAALMIAIGVFARRRTRNEAEFLVAGRRLGPLMYTGTMAAVVIGGASTIGGVGLGYEYGVSGMWLVFSIGCGVLLLSVCFAGRINRLGLYTVGDMLNRRYGPGAGFFAGIVMCAYTMMLAVTSTIAYGAIFGVLFELGKVPAILIGGSVVVIYSALGGMWSITLTDFIQFLIKTAGIFLILLPTLLFKVGGLAGLRAELPASAFSLVHIGGDTILGYFIIYVLGLIIGQDIWQRVFTARSDSVARWGGMVAGVYCLFYALAGALIGMCAKVILPEIVDRNAVYAEIVRHSLPVGISGLVIAAALAAIMSTSSGALIATATVAKQDLVRGVREWSMRRTNDPLPRSPALVKDENEVHNHRTYLLGAGVVMIGLACIVADVVVALTIAYDILVGGLLVAIVGGLVWNRGTFMGAVSSMVAGTVCTIGTMLAERSIFSNKPIFVGLAVSSAVYVVASLLRPTKRVAVH